MAALTAGDVRRRRMTGQGLTATGGCDAAAVVRKLGAVQAQDYAASLWAIGVRTGGATEAAVERALSTGVVVRTWPMRGTLHHVHAADVHWMLELCTPRVIALSAGRYRQLELDGGVFDRSRRLLERALADGARTRHDAYAHLESGGVSTAGTRGLHILSHLAQQGVICFGPREGRQPTFVLLDAWVARGPRLERDEALAELAARYFDSHGPATAHDFAWWSGLTLKDARRGIALAGAQLESVAHGGVEHWQSPDGATSRSRIPGAVLLPAFDEYVVAYRDRTAVIEAANAAAIGGGGILSPVLVSGGRIRGTWRRVIGRTAVRLTLHPFEPLGDAASRAAAAAAARYGAFLGLPVDVA